MVRVIACDDGEVRKLGEGYTLVVCVRWSGKSGLEDFLAAPIPVDGANATDIILKLIYNLKYEYIIDAVVLDSITIAGFNYVNVRRLAVESRIPIIITYTYRPDSGRLLRALRKAGLLDKKERIISIKQVDDAVLVNTRKGDLYIIVEGVRLARARELIEEMQAFDRKPVPLRLAHYIASALSRILSF